MPFYDSLAKINSNRRARPILVITYTSIFSKNFCDFLPDTNAAKYKEYISQYDIRRFVNAHRRYMLLPWKKSVVERNGHTECGIFPQLRGIGYRHNAEYYGIYNKSNNIFISKSLKAILLPMMMLISSLNVFADSPLTSIDFYKAYLDVAIVKAAADNPNKLSEEMMAYLHNETNPLDVKLALINAVGYDKDDGILNTYGDYILYCIDHFPKEMKRSDPSGLITPQDIFDNASPEQKAVLVYLRAMSHYTNMLYAYSLAETAMQNPVSSESFMLPMALVWAQMKLLMNDWGNIYPSFQYLFGNARKKDMRPEARKIINDYMDLYVIDEAAPQSNIEVQS